MIRGGQMRVEQDQWRHECLEGASQPSERGASRHEETDAEFHDARWLPGGDQFPSQIDHLPGQFDPDREHRRSLPCHADRDHTSMRDMPRAGGAVAGRLAGLTRAGSVN